MRVIYVSKGEVRDYMPGVDRLWKFLVLKSGEIIAGYDEYSCHHDLAEAYARVSGRFGGETFIDTDLKAALVGAGDVHGGRLTGWESTGFRVTTPEPIRASVLAALGVPALR